MESKFNMPKKCTATQAQWDEATERYELGYIHANRLALELGVSPQTVMREMRKRGAIKGARAFETVVDLAAELDRKIRHRAHLKAVADRRAVDHAMATLSTLDVMMAAILDADRQGDLRLAKVAIDLTGEVLGSPPPGRLQPRSR